uniref:Uncharacterized protein n=1 Tax=Cyanoderma ruficeps TaxID=181631 RepID=A0A8C3NY07_9PASS
PVGGDFPRKRKRSRWNQDSLEQKTVIPGMPTVIPPGLTREQERAYIGNAYNDFAFFSHSRVLSNNLVVLGNVDYFQNNLSF